jgi:Zn-finger nucleic acid-binding protein
MNCPKCNAEFESLSFGDIQVERCSNCKGLWLDTLKKDDLLKIDGSETIDIGSEQVGRQYSELQDIDCPQCNMRMIPMVDKDQFHIKYESCANCYGTFFDAGEYRDLKEHTVLERFNQMLKTLRKNL